MAAADRISTIRNTFTKEGVHVLLLTCGYDDLYQTMYTTRLKKGPCGVENPMRIFICVALLYFFNRPTATYPAVYLMALLSMALSGRTELDLTHVRCDLS